MTIKTEYQNSCQRHNTTKMALLGVRLIFLWMSVKTSDPKCNRICNTYYQLSHELLVNLLLLNHEDCVIRWMPSKQTHAKV